MKRTFKARRTIHKQPKIKFMWLQKINVFKYLSIILIILFIVSIPTVIKKIIKINKIECQSQFGECPQKLMQEILYVGDYKAVKQKVDEFLRHDGQVNSYLIQYKIPSTLKVNILIKKPRYVIKSLDSKYYTVDKDGTALDLGNVVNLPTLEDNAANLNLGEKVSDVDLFSLHVIEKVLIINAISKSIIDNNILSVTLDNGIVIKFPIEGDVDVLVGSLRLIFSRLNEGTQGIRMEDVHEIDLRFNNPVIR